MKLGVCADPKYGPALADVGFEFLELHVQNHLKTLEDEDAFLAERARIQGEPIPALAANCFVPGSLKITGPDVDMGKLEQYVEVALSRAERAGIETVVFGSGGARRIPEGTDRGEAWQQLVAFGKMVGPVAEDINTPSEPGWSIAYYLPLMQRYYRDGVAGHLAEDLRLAAASQGPTAFHWWPYVLWTDPSVPDVAPDVHSG